MQDKNKTEDNVKPQNNIRYYFISDRHCAKKKFVHGLPCISNETRNI